MNKIIEDLRNQREEIIPECKEYDERGPCKRIDPENPNLCNATLSPKVRWKLGPCNLATHVTVIVGEEGSGKTRVGQQKQKKKSRR